MVKIIDWNIAFRKELGTMLNLPARANCCTRSLTCVAAVTDSTPTKLPSKSYTSRSLPNV